MGLHEMRSDDPIHQANIEIDEEGTEAAAATAITKSKSSCVTKCICNRPFMFLICDKKSRDILFGGVYRGPINNDN